MLILVSDVDHQKFDTLKIKTNPTPGTEYNGYVKPTTIWEDIVAFDISRVNPTYVCL